MSLCDLFFESDRDLAAIATEIADHAGWKIAGLSPRIPVVMLVGEHATATLRPVAPSAGNKGNTLFSAWAGGLGHPFPGGPQMLAVLAWILGNTAGEVAYIVDLLLILKRHGGRVVLNSDVGVWSSTAKREIGESYEEKPLGFGGV